MNDLKYFNFEIKHHDNFATLNQQLIAGLNEHIDNESTRKSHHFFGRYENIYIDADKIPALSNILDSAKTYAAEILGCTFNELKAGLWFNVMNPGDKTTLHRHDDDDELLSAVYYVKVADDSGALHLKKSTVDIKVTPAEGMFVFFPPNLPHEVSKNLSQECRISLGINIGPAIETT